MKIRTAVFPVAGMGTRFLPATKASPKEMMPIVDKPLIQFAVEEAVAAGMTDLIFITGRGKRAIEDHFDVAFELETFLEQRGKLAQLEEIRSISRMLNVAYVRQGEPLGLGQATAQVGERVTEAAHRSVRLRRGRSRLLAARGAPAVLVLAAAPARAGVVPADTIGGAHPASPGDPARRRSGQVGVGPPLAGHRQRRWRVVGVEVVVGDRTSLDGGGS